MMQQILSDEIIKLQPRGVFTVPKKLREGLFDKNGIARIKRVGSTLVIEPLRTLPYSVRTYSSEDLKDFFEFDDNESKKLKEKGII